MSQVNGNARRDLQDLRARLFISLISSPTLLGGRVVEVAGGPVGDNVFTQSERVCGVGEARKTVVRTTVLRNNARHKKKL